MSATNELLQKWLEKFGDAWDAGPPREGWQSDELLALIEQTRAALVERKAEPVHGVDGQVLVAAREMTADQKKQPEWLWYNHVSEKRSFGRWAAYDNQAPYIRADLVFSTPPAAPVTEKMIDAAARVLNKRLGEGNGLHGVSRDMLEAALSASPSPVDSRDAFERCARLIEENIIKETSNGKVLAPRQEGNRDGLHYANAIRALAAKEQQP